VHILVVHQYYLRPDEAGGSRWNEFARYWAAAGHRVTVLAGMVHYATGRKHPEYRRRFLVTEHEPGGITVRRCHVSEAYNRSFLGRAWAYASFAVSSTIAGLGVKRPDVIVCTSPPLTVGLTGVALAQWHRRPMVFEVRDLWPDFAIETGVLRSGAMIRVGYWLERLSYRRAARISVLTPAFERTLREKKGVPAEKLVMIPNGADLDLVAPGERDNAVRRELGLTGKFVVTYVGAHGVANHLIQLLEAARILQSERPQVQLLLIGDGMEKPMLRQRASDWGLENVTFVDPVPKERIGEYLAASDACTAVLKRVEGFKTVYPNKVFDYMAAARPVVLGIDGVARKLVEQAGAGLFVEPEDPQAFAAAVGRLADDPDRAAQMGERGRAYVREHFSRAVLAQRYLGVLQSLVAP
jgi:glycosyltransferase involved in cell wall biosynthesis